jgi:hypothetical protein
MARESREHSFTKEKSKKEIQLTHTMNNDLEKQGRKVAAH